MPGAVDQGRPTQVATHFGTVELPGDLTADASGKDDWSHGPQRLPPELLVPALGAVSATTMAAMMSSMLATPALADRITRGDTRATLRLLGRVAFARSAAGLLLLPAIGRLADRYGRKGVLVATSLTTALGNAAIALAPSAETLLLGQALMGSLGVGGALDAVRDASLADVLRGSALATATAKTRAFMAVGLIAGPILGGFAAKRDHRLPYAVAAAASLVGALLTATFAEETLPPSRRSEAARTQDREGGVLALHRCLNPVTSLELFRRSSRLRWLTVATILSVSADYNNDILPLFCRDRVGWDAVDIGKFSALGGVFAVVSSMSCATALGLLGRRRLTLLATAASALRHLTNAGARSSAAMYATHVLGILVGGMTMRLTAMLSRHTEVAKQDGLGGAEATAMRGNAFALARLVVPPFMTRLYRPGAEGTPYLLSAALSATSGVLILSNLADLK